jgi:hypothetical protein
VSACYYEACPGGLPRMRRCARRHSVALMTESDRDRDAPGQRSIAPSVAVWNAVVPALALALILGVAVLPAIAVAGAASIAIHAVLAPESQRAQCLGWITAHAAPHRVPRRS